MCVCVRACVGGGGGSRQCIRYILKYHFSYANYGGGRESGVFIFAYVLNSDLY